MMNFFSLVDCAEIHLLGEDERVNVVVRLELFRCSRSGRYRGKLWREELYRLTPAFPRDENDQPTELSDDTMFVDWSFFVKPSLDDFDAASDDAAWTHAVDTVIETLRRAGFPVDDPVG